MPEHLTLKLTQIRTDGDTQARVKIDKDVLADYIALYREGVIFPPLEVRFDGKQYWLVDGHIRHGAASIAGLTEHDVVVVPGKKLDAQWASYGANKTHGAHRTSADKQNAVRMALKHPNAAGMSDRELADHVGVSHPTVAKYRPQHPGPKTPAPANRVGSGNFTTSPTNGGGNGKRAKKAWDALSAGVRKSAEALGCSDADVVELAALPAAKQSDVLRQVRTGEFASLSECLNGKDTVDQDETEPEKPVTKPSKPSKVPIEQQFRPAYDALGKLKRELDGLRAMHAHWRYTELMTLLNNAGEMLDDWKGAVK
jgi:hypothetical protein